MSASLLARCPLRWRHGRARALFAFTAFLRHDSAAARDKFSALQLASGCRRTALTNGGLALCRQPGGVTCRGTPAAAAESRRASRLSRRPIALPRDAPQNLLISPCDVQSQMLLRQGMARNAVLSRASSVLHFQQRFMGAGPTGYGSGPYRGLKVPKVAEWHKNVATVYGTILWLWLFWRCKNDGPALLVRRACPPP